jgi:hypothetical protein
VRHFSTPFLVGFFTAWDKSSLYLAVFGLPHFWLIRRFTLSESANISTESMDTPYIGTPDALNAPVLNATTPYFDAMDNSTNQTGFIPPLSDTTELG